LSIGQGFERKTEPNEYLYIAAIKDNTDQECMFPLWILRAIYFVTGIELISIESLRTIKCHQYTDEARIFWPL